MHIAVKRIYDEPASDDGTRILVDRLWPRGVNKTRAAIDDWARELAPSSSLRQWFGHDPARFDEFARRYRKELAANSAAVTALLDRLDRRRRLTLLTTSRDLDNSHAVVLKKHLEEQG